MLLQFIDAIEVRALRRKSLVSVNKIDRELYALRASSGSSPGGVEGREAGGAVDAV